MDEKTLKTVDEAIGTISSTIKYELDRDKITTLAKVLAKIMKARVELKKIRIKLN